jgi:hypothetical protein
MRLLTIDLPVPLKLVKSPPCNIKFGITRWKIESLYHKGFPGALFSPVQRQLIRKIKQIKNKNKDMQDATNRKFSAVFGQTSAFKVISIRPAGEPPMETSKKTTGFGIL